MFLAIDVGNTQGTLGLYDETGAMRHGWRMATTSSDTADTLRSRLGGYLHMDGFDYPDVTEAGLACVVPVLSRAWRRCLTEVLGRPPLVVSPGMDCGMEIRMPEPRSVGADRIANAVAARADYGAPVIVVDFGTATTFCAVDKKGTYLGGAICPGIGISTDALVQRTAKLPRIEVVRTDKVICRNTVESMQAGVFYGFVGQVDGIVARMRKELGCKAKVVATGGLAVIVAPATDAIDVVEPMLTLEGLKIIYDRNN